MTKPAIDKVTVWHSLAWLWEPLEGDPSFLLRSMFGMKAIYLGGKMVLCLGTRKKPWGGMLVCTERCHQASLLADFPELGPHPVLPKWLYLPDTADRFDSVAEKLVALALSRDPRIGIVPKPKKRRGL